MSTIVDLDSHQIVIDLSASELSTSDTELVSSNEPSIEEIDEEPIECCVCFRNPDNDKHLVLCDNRLSDIKKTYIKNLEKRKKGLWRNVLVKSCCGVQLDSSIHYVCIGCLYKISVNFDNHPIGVTHSLIPCPYPYEDCITPIGIPNYFSHNDIRKVINDDEEFLQYMNHAERYEFPGYEIVKCPRPMIMQNHENVRHDTKCGASILIPIERIKRSSPGKLIIECDQNKNCLRKSCYHCESLIRKYGEIDENMYCEFCLTSTENTNPRAYNPYYYKFDKRRKDGNYVFHRNEELTIDIVIPQLLEIVESDKGYIRCFECLTFLQKTEQCNTVTCCGIDRCYACGRSGSLDRELGDHWDATGLTGCPRFDHSSFWNEWGECNFECREGYCYNQELGDCGVVDHQYGINKMIEIRKNSIVYHSIKSLLPELRKHILKEIRIRPDCIKLKKYIYKYESSDYRTYNPDLIQRKYRLAQISIEETERIIEEMEKQCNLHEQYPEPRVNVSNPRHRHHLSIGFDPTIEDDIESIGNICYIEDDEDESLSNTETEVLLEDNDGQFIDMEDIEECRKIINKIGNLQFTLINN